MLLLITCYNDIERLSNEQQFLIEPAQIELTSLKNYNPEKWGLVKTLISNCGIKTANQQIERAHYCQLQIIKSTRLSRTLLILR